MPKGRKPAKCWYLVIGVGKTDDSTGLSFLEYAGSDCRDIAALFKNNKQSPIDTVIALHDDGGDDLLPTVENVTKHLKQIQSSAGEKDTVVVYLTCHGVKDDGDKLYFCLSDTKGEGKEINFATAFPAQQLVEILVRSKAQNIILLIDSCHSGAVDFPESLSLSGLNDNRTFYGIFSCLSAQQAYAPHQIGSALMSYCLKKVLRGEFKLSNESDELRCHELFLLLKENMEKIHQGLNDYQDKVNYSTEDNSILPEQQLTCKTVASNNPIISRIDSNTSIELPQRRGLIVNPVSDEVGNDLVAKLTKKGSFNNLECWDGTQDLLTAIEDKLKRQNGTVLFYIRGELLEDNRLRINSQIVLSGDSLYKLLSQYQSVKQVLLFDVVTEDSARVKAWINTIKINSQLGQCIVVYNYFRQNTNLCNEVIKLLAATEKPAQGLNAAQFIHQLQQSRLNKQCEYYLDGKRDIIEIIVSPQARDIYHSLRFWRNYAINSLPQEITSNFLTAFVDRDKNFKLDDIYVPLGLVERKEKPKQQDIRDSERGSDIYTLEPTEITQKFYKEEFLEKILGNKEGKSQGRRIAITGEPGSGKTTYLQKISNWIFLNTETIPIWISLARLGEYSLRKYIEEVWLTNISDNPETKIQLKAALIDLFESGNVWLILDGVDEIGSREKLSEIAGYLEDKYISQARIILSCRLNTWETSHQLLSSFDTYRTLPFEDEQISEFSGKFFTVITDKDNLLQQLENNQRIKDLVRNPLRLMLLCLAWVQGNQTLPDTQAELYKLFVEQFYFYKQENFPIFKEENRDINRQLKQAINNALGEIAKAALDRDNPTFLIELDNLDAAIREQLDKIYADKTVAKWIIDLGWLNKVGVKADSPSQDVYAFFHATFQEYFAATVIDDWDYFLPRNHTNFPIPNKKYRVFESQWKQVILLWVGRNIAVEDKEQFLDKLISFKDDCGDWNEDLHDEIFGGIQTEFVDRGLYEYRSYFLAAELVSESSNLSQIKEIVLKLSKLAFGFQDDRSQKRITYQSSISKSAKSILETIVHPETISCLIQIINTTYEKYIYRNVAWSLEKVAVGNPEAISTLLSLINNTSINSDKSIIYDLVKSLAKIDPGNSEAIHFLFLEIKKTWNKTISYNALNCLTAIDPDNPKIIPLLTQIINNASNESVVFRAAASLHCLDPGNPDAMPTILELAQNWGTQISDYSTKTIPDLIRIIEEATDKDIRRDAADTLAKVGVDNPQAISGLIRIIEDTTDKDIRRDTGDILAKVGVDNPQAISGLIRIIEDTSNKDTRLDAVKILGKIGIGNSQAISALIGIIENAFDDKILIYAGESLKKVGKNNSQAISGLIQIMENTDDHRIRIETTFLLILIDPSNLKGILSLIKIIDKTLDIEILEDALYLFRKGLSSYLKMLDFIEIDIAYSQLILSISQIAKKVSDNFPSETVRIFAKLFESNSISKLEFFSQLKVHYKNRYAYFELRSISQSLSYPEFYNVWNSSSNNHSETANQTLEINQLNITNLPQILNQKLQQNTELQNQIQLIYINGNNFTNTQNPTLDIYIQMVRQGCPIISNRPTAMNEFSAYWHLDVAEIDKQAVLIFYENNDHSSNFTPDFLEALSKFDGAICFISNTTAPLKHFYPSQPNLIENIMGWMRSIVLESV